MPTYTFNGDLVYRVTCDGGGTLANAWDGTGTFTSSTTGDRRTPGRINTDQCSQELHQWDTSAIPETEFVTRAYVTFAVAAGAIGTSYNMLLYAFDHGGSGDDSDFRSRTWLTANSPVGSTDTSTWGASGSFVVELASSCVNRSGSTRLIAASSHQRDSVDPGANSYHEYVEGGTFQVLTVITVAFTPKFSHWPRERRVNRSYIGW